MWRQCIENVNRAHLMSGSHYEFDCDIYSSFPCHIFYVFAAYFIRRTWYWIQLFTTKIVKPFIPWFSDIIKPWSGFRSWFYCLFTVLLIKDKISLQPYALQNIHCGHFKWINISKGIVQWMIETASCTLQVLCTHYRVVVGINQINQIKTLTSIIWNWLNKNHLNSWNLVLNIQSPSTRGPVCVCVCVRLRVCVRVCVCVHIFPVNSITVPQ